MGVRHSRIPRGSFRSVTQPSGTVDTTNNIAAINSIASHSSVELNPALRPSSRASSSSRVSDASSEIIYTDMRATVNKFGKSSLPSRTNTHKTDSDVIYADIDWVNSNVAKPGNKETVLRHPKPHKQSSIGKEISPSKSPKLNKGVKVSNPIKSPTKKTKKQKKTKDNKWVDPLTSDRSEAIYNELMNQPIPTGRQKRDLSYLLVKLLPKHKNKRRDYNYDHYVRGNIIDGLSNLFQVKKHV